MMHFRIAGDTTREPDDSYDAIFALAVLRRGELQHHPGDRCDHLIRFQDFDRQLVDFARCLRPGGLLLLRHCNFRLKDSSVADAFDTLLSFEPSTRTDTPLFGRDNVRITTLSEEDVAFRRRPHSAEVRRR